MVDEPITEEPSERILPSHQLSIPEAQRLADLVSIDNDLKTAHVFLTELMRDAPKPANAAYFRAAFIAYRRAFDRTTRGLEATDVAFLGDALVTLHNQILAQASKFVAHPVNASEEVKIGVVLDNDVIVGVARVIFSLDGWNKDQLNRWGWITEKLIETVLKPRLEEAEAAVLAAAKLIPLHQIKRAPTVGYKVPRQEDAGTPRSRR